MVVIFGKKLKRNLKHHN